MKNKEKTEFEDDGRALADMQDLELQPILIPRFGGTRRDKEKGVQSQASVYLDKDEKRAFVRAALAAGLAVGLVIAAAFGALILLISHMA